MRCFMNKKYKTSFLFIDFNKFIIDIYISILQRNFKQRKKFTTSAIKSFFQKGTLCQHFFFQNNIFTFNRFPIDSDPLPCIRF